MSDFERNMRKTGWMQCRCGCWMLPGDGSECTSCKAARICLEALVPGKVPAKCFWIVQTEGIRLQDKGL